MMDHHLKVMDSLCRICTRRAQTAKEIKAKKKASTAANRETIYLSFFGVAGELNLDGAYLQLLDKYCNITWEEDSCKSCNLFREQSQPFSGRHGQTGHGCKRGRPKHPNPVISDPTKHCTQ